MQQIVVCCNYCNMSKVVISEHVYRGCLLVNASTTFFVFISECVLSIMSIRPIEWRRTEKINIDINTNIRYNNVT